MKCNEFVGLIPHFVDDSLEQIHYEGFVKHARECSECKDELEIHYMIQVGLERIEEEAAKSFDIEGELHNRLQRYERIADKQFKRSVYMKIVLVLAHLSAIISVVQVVSVLL